MWRKIWPGNERKKKLATVNIVVLSFFLLFFLFYSEFLILWNKEHIIYIGKNSIEIGISNDDDDLEEKKKPWKIQNQRFCRPTRQRHFYLYFITSTTISVGVVLIFLIFFFDYQKEKKTMDEIFKILICDDWWWSSVVVVVWENFQN